MTMVARTRKRHVYLKSLHETYGPFVRISESVLISRIYLICLLAPNVLSIVDVDAIQPVLGPRKCLTAKVSLVKFSHSLNGVNCKIAHQLFLSNKSETNLTSEINPAKHAEFHKAWHCGFTPTTLTG